MRICILGLFTGLARAAGLLGGKWMVEAREISAPSEGLWSDFCYYFVDDASARYGYQYGSLKYVGGLVGNYDGSFLSDGFAQNALGSWECQRVY